MCADMKKSVGLPAPIDPFRVQLGPHFEDCNPSSEFNMDDQVSQRFHELFADKHGCHIPFLGGDRYVTMVSPQSAFCTKMSDYNTTQGEEFAASLFQISFS